MSSYGHLNFVAMPFFDIFQTRKIMGEESMLHLNWNNFGDNFINLVKDFREDKDFHDVRLLCEDGVMVSANKFLLSCCSNFFKFVFKKTLQANVVIYLKGVKGNHMKSILDFIYHGSTNVNENQLTTFLEAANDLKIRGLVETSQLHAERFPKDDSQTQSELLKTSSGKYDDIAEDEPSDHILIDEDELKIEANNANIQDMGSSSRESTMVSPNNSTPQRRRMKPGLYTANIVATLGQTWEPTWNTNSHTCKVCGKSFAYKHVLENHIETHMDCSYPCDECHKIFKTRNSLKSHISQKHRNGHSSTPNKLH